MKLANEPDLLLDCNFCGSNKLQMYYSLKEDRGEIKGKYLGLLVWESAEARDKYFGSSSGESPSNKLPEEWKMALQKLATLSTDTFTGYVIIGD